MTAADVITAIVAVLALLLSVYNTVTQIRDRRPRVRIVTSWDYPRDAATAFQGSAEPGQALYRCEITNVGRAGVKINRVKVFHLTSPGKPITLQLAPGEQPKKLDNGDSQTWIYDFGWDFIKPRVTSLNTSVNVLAWDSVGNTYQAKDPAPLP